MKVKIFNQNVAQPANATIAEGHINEWLLNNTTPPTGGVTGAPISIVSVFMTTAAAADGQLHHTATYMYNELVAGTTGTYQ